MSPLLQCQKEITLLLEASKWETMGGGGGALPGRIRARGVRKHERKGQEVGVLKGWEACEIRGK